MTTSLAVPNEYDAIIDLVVNACGSRSTRTRYATKLRVFMRYWDHNGRPPFDRQFVLQYVAQMRSEKFPGFAINQSLTAVKKLAKEAHYAGFMNSEAQRGIDDIPGCKVRGTPQGSRLTEAEILQLLGLPRTGTLIGKRDRVVLELLFYAGLRREEVALVRMEHVQRLENRPVLLNLHGKGGRVRTVPIPEFMLEHIEEWVGAAGITEGPLCRSVNRHGHVGAAMMSGKGVYNILVGYARTMGKRNVSPHSIRRTMGSLARAKGVELDQIQMVYGHASVTMTQHYIGGNLNIQNAVCDALPVAP